MSREVRPLIAAVSGASLELIVVGAAKQRPQRTTCIRWKPVRGLLGGKDLTGRLGHVLTSHFG